MPKCKLQIVRPTGIGDPSLPVEVFLDGKAVFELAADELKAVFSDAEEVRISVKQAGQTLLVAGMKTLKAERIKLQLWREAPKGVLRMFKRPALRLVEVERAALAPMPSMPKADVTLQFWMGHAETADHLHRMMAERPEYYSEENEDAEGTPDFVGLSEFSDLMGQDSYDHDFVEPGFAKSGGALETRFAGASWVDKWAPVLREMIAEDTLDRANAFVLASVDTPPGRPAYRQFKNPVDAVADGVHLKYIGEITLPSH